MGSFYGNITNTSKTQFQFDKIYPNRYEMERQKSADGIYAGRYILIEYDSAYQQDDFYRVWIFDNKLYNTNEKDSSYLIRLGTTEGSNANKKMTSVPAGTIVFTADVKTSVESGTYYTNIKYYQITDEKSTDGHASFKEVVNGLDSPNYTINYNIDVSTYGAGRGYDSTVWQKAYIDGYEKYIMIAELNSVVPTFDVSADAPTMDPLIPHFDTQSTDIYYKLHWQPSWGFRIAEGETDNRKTESEDAAAGTYPSDIDVSYNRNEYHAATGKNTITPISYPGAIFFNKAGLDETIHNEYDGEFKDTNEISIQPTGISGNKYNTHDGSSDVKEAPDIQEVKVLLPALGNTICAAWDKVYGYDPENDNKRFRDTQWKDAKTGKEFEGEIVPQPDNKGEESLGYMTRDSETIAGCINLVHDLLGMILVNGDVTLNEVTYNTKRIYYRNGGYYRIYRYPRYEEVDVSEIVSLDPSQFSSDQEYNAEFERRINEILDGYADEDWYLVIDKSSDNWQVQRFSKKALTAANFNNGQSLAHILKDTYGYQWQEIKGFATDLSTINGLILELRNLIESDDSGTRNRETVQGTINTLNDIINIFEDLVPGEFLICDANGHVNSANWTTAQPYSYNNIGTSNSSLATTDENQWIKVDLDESNRLISITHQVHAVDDTNTELNVNADETLTDDIKLYTPITDNMGHIVGKNTQTVTLPYGFKYIQSDPIYAKDAVDDALVNSERIEAISTQDTLSVKNSNKWIKTSADDKSHILFIGHEVHDFESGEANKYYGLERDESVASLDEDNKFEVPCLKFDEAGHITGARTHTVVLPENFKSIEVMSSIQEDTIGSSQAGTIEADTMEDILTFAEGDQWINLAADKDNDKITIYHNKPGKQTGTTATDSETPKFGGTITIPEVKYDKTGHITSVSTHTAKIPAPSLVANTSGNVITGIELVSEDGKFTLVGKNVGELTLTGYNTAGATSAISATDSINRAFGLLQTHVDSTDANLKVEAQTREKAIADEVAARKAAIEALDANGTMAAGETIKSWEEIDGKVSIIPQTIVITDANIANAAIAMSKISGLEDALDGKESKGAAEKVKTALLDGAEATNTIKVLLEKIDSLNNEITSLKSRVSALENNDSGT